MNFFNFYIGTFLRPWLWFLLNLSLGVLNVAIAIYNLQHTSWPIHGSDWFHAIVIPIATLATVLNLRSSWKLWWVLTTTRREWEQIISGDES